MSLPAPENANKTANALSNNFSHMFMTIMKSQEALTSTIATLKEEVDRLKLTPTKTATFGSHNSKTKFIPQSPAPKQTRKMGKKWAKSEPPSSITTPKKGKKHTPQKTKISSHESPPGSKGKRRKNKLQMCGDDLPPAFKSVKDVFYLHIKALWDVKEQDAIPEPQTQEELVNFYRKFSNAQQIETTVQDSGGGLELEREDDLQKYAKAQLEPATLGRGMKNLSQLYIDYVGGMPTRIGFTHWRPNLTPNCDDLYNVACQITAIVSFQKLVVGGAYNEYSMNFTYFTKAGLLQKANDHFIHYWIKARWDKERRVQGSCKAGKMKSNSNQNRSRLQDARLDFAIVNKLSKRYCQIIEETGVHSDDEQDEQKKDRYNICTLRYRSRKANIFFRKLDECMAGSANNLGGTTHMRNQVLPKKTNRVKPSLVNQIMKANLSSVAFLPNPEEALNVRPNANGKLSTKQFNKKYHDIVAEAYEIKTEEDSASEEDI
ncbi:hypothetical protein O181_082495 [Austropuccinia psidii MF-1]|uniref:Uncharacterized protein n=1 Tax=Austropuccinia psidii MF-1 TaxID=1389203 RepID=A0A9Q3FRZ2_9BASI|nr:hypothetical protein [Austropuccinia psidii MF-1]